MTAFIASTALFVILVMALLMFGNELYYRKRVSVVGVLLLICFGYLTWYQSQLVDDIRELSLQLAKYQTVKLPRGE